MGAKFIDDATGIEYETVSNNPSKVEEDAAFEKAQAAQSGGSGGSFAEPAPSVGQQLLETGKRTAEGLSSLINPVPTIVSALQKTKTEGIGAGIKEATKPLQAFEPLGLGVRAAGAGVESARTGKSFRASFAENEGGKQVARALPGVEEGSFAETGIGFGIEALGDLSGPLLGLGKRAIGAVKGAKTAIKTGIEAAEKKFLNSLTSTQRKGAEFGIKKQIETSARKVPGGQGVFADVTENSKKIFNDELTPELQKIVSPKTAELTFKETGEQLTDKVSDIIKGGEKELKQRFTDMDALLKESGQPATRGELVSAVGDKLKKMDIINESGNKVNFDPLGPVSKESTHNALFDQFDKLQTGGVASEPTITFDKLRNFRRGLRENAKTFKTQGDNATATALKDMERTVTDYMAEVSERALGKGGGDQFRLLDKDFAVFKDFTDNLKVLNLSDEQAVSKILSLTTNNKAELADILQENPEALELVRGLVFKNAIKQSKRGVSQNINFDNVANNLNKISENLGADILGEEASTAIGRWLENAEKAGFFKIPPASGLAKESVVTGIPANLAAGAITRRGAGGLIRKTAETAGRFGTIPAVREVDKGQRFGAGR